MIAAPFLRILTAMLVTLTLLVGCGQPGDNASESAAASDPMAMDKDAESHTMDHGVKSIDADGNVAPFGMASKKPVEVAAAPGADAPAWRGWPASELAVPASESGSPPRCRCSAPCVTP